MSAISQPVSSGSLFSQSNIIADQGEAPITVLPGLSSITLPNGTGGSIYGIGVSLSEAATAGNLFFRCAINGTPVGAQFDAGLALADTNAFFRRLPSALASWAAGGGDDHMEVLLQSVGLAPLTIDVIVTPYLIINRGTALNPKA